MRRLRSSARTSSPWSSVSSACTLSPLSSPKITRSRRVRLQMAETRQRSFNILIQWNPTSTCQEVYNNRAALSSPTLCNLCSRRDTRAVKSSSRGTSGSRMKSWQSPWKSNLWGSRSTTTTAIIWGRRINRFKINKCRRIFRSRPLSETSSILRKGHEKERSSTDLRLRSIIVSLPVSKTQWLWNQSKS
jgi:hypothetical protein